jgi:hypothetical protein
MQKQSEIARSQNGLTTSLIEKSVILKEQTDRKEVLKNLVYLLNRIAKLYQIPNFDNENAVLLASWIFETYKYDPFETIEKALTNPKPIEGENQWRLNPDTVSKFINAELEKKAEQLELEHTKTKSKTIEFTLPAHTEEFSSETNKMIQDFINDLSAHQKTAPMTEEMINEMGKERLKPRSISAGHLTTNKEYLIEKELRRQWSLEVHDKYTGKPLENWLSFEEWKMI